LKNLKKSLEQKKKSFLTLNNVAGKLGFPTNLSDDSVLGILMQAEEPFAHAEERRLFYVAMTRAKRCVYLLVRTDSKSVFVKELKKDLFQESKSKKANCPRCIKGRLIMRRGPHGYFYGCSNFPLCQFTQKKEP